MFPGDFCFQGKDKSFSIFTGSLRALTFQFVVRASRLSDYVCVSGLCSSFYNPRRLFRYFSCVSNISFFHASQNAETRLVLSADCTGAFTLSQANIYRLGPSVRVVPD